VVAVVGAVLVVVDQPRLQGPVQQTDVVDADAVEVGSVERAQQGAVEPLAHRVVVRRAERDPVMDQPELFDPGLEGLPTNSGPLSVSTPVKVIPCLRSAFFK
jgi:hypothetical protein